MQPPPLPVDVTSTWWDYVVDVADVLAGLGTMGALVVASFVFFMQEQDKRRAQAIRVVVSESTDTTDMTTDNSIVTIENRSDLPIYEVTVFRRKRASGANFTTPEVWEIIPKIVGSSDWSVIVKDVSEPDLELKVVFRDSAGRWWDRRANGSLRKISNRQWLRDVRRN